MDTEELVEKLKELRNEGHSLSTISKIVGYSPTYIKKLNKKHNIPKGIGKPSKLEKCVTCDGGLVGNQTRYCSDFCKMQSFLKKRDKTSVWQYQKIKGYDRKKELIKLKGGKCQVCGYNKSLRALTFHHVDPKLKSFTLDIRELSTRGLVSILEEADKCVLLCFNCHMELHENECNN